MRSLTRSVILLFISALIGCGGSSAPPAKTLSFLYAVGQGLNSVQAFDVTQLGDLLPASVPSFPTNPRPAAMALHPSSNFLYVTSFAANTVSGFSVDHTAGILTPVGTALPPLPTGPSPIAAGVNAGGNFLFVLNQGDNSVSIYSIDPARGILTQIGSPFPTALASVQSMVLSPTAQFLYISSGNSIAGFSISGSGTLAPIGSFPGIAGSAFGLMAIDPKGQVLYAPDSANNEVFSFSIAASGTLSTVAGSPFAAGTQPAGVAVNSTGTFVYVSNAGSSNLSAFSSANGVLKQISGSPYTTIGTGSTNPTQPGFVTIDASNNFVVVSNVGTKAIAVFQINPADGTLTPAQNSPFAGTLASSWMISTHK